MYKSDYYLISIYKIAHHYAFSKHCCDKIFFLNFFFILYCDFVFFKSSGTEFLKFAPLHCIEWQP